MKELTWQAVYHKDGDITEDSEIYSQFNPDGTENPYKDIDRFRLGRFDLLHEGKIVYSLVIRKNQRLIFRRRSLVALNGDLVGLVFLVGWVMTITTPSRQRNLYAINYLQPDGSIVLDNHRSNLSLLSEEL